MASAMQIAGMAVADGEGIPAFLKVLDRGLTRLAIPRF
jgi:hypothetical protein